MACQTGSACIAGPGTTDARPDSDIPRWPPPEVRKSSSCRPVPNLELVFQYIERQQVVALLDGFAPSLMGSVAGLNAVRLCAVNDFLNTLAYLL